MSRWIVVFALLGAAGAGADPHPVGPTPKSLEYAVRVLGIGMTSRVTIDAEGPVLSISSTLDAPLFGGVIARNDHTTRFEPRDCDPRQLSYVNVGGILAWRFEDRVEFDWDGHTIDYRGRDGERRYAFSGETFVDKLSQYEAIACRLRAGDSDFTLNYVDDRIARYRFVVDGEEVIESPAGTFRTVRLVAGPERTELGLQGYHGRVTYWLAPEIGFYPVRIRAASRRPFRIALELRTVVRGTDGPTSELPASDHRVRPVFTIEAPR
ncbi:MAG: DUF3108 domain-containing protein [Gammaproteobacteria bacterium]|nr:DUF3108 domain-containing protein [Gammaproteobacteria bacterium]